MIIYFKQTFLTTEWTTLLIGVSNLAFILEILVLFQSGSPIHPFGNNSNLQSAHQNPRDFPLSIGYFKIIFFLDKVTFLK